MDKKAIIIGAGPAGLTAAYELLKRTDIIPVILEKSGEIGGISRTINYKGNRMDMGPHRFFSKSDRVMDWWLKIMPLEENNSETTISYQNKTREVHSTAHDAINDDKVMLVIRRLTRIYFLRKFFAYPIQLSLATLRGLGAWRTLKILLSFMWVKLFPRKPEKSLEDFIINKFGGQLYLLFFKDYTEKVWGVPCSDISAEWGAQRIKGVSLGKAISQAAKSLRKGRGSDINQKETETSLIEQFLYPKKGPGALWEEVARQVKEMGGKIYLHQEVSHIHHEGGQVTTVNSINTQTGQTGAWEGDYFFSTMPVQDLIAGMGTEVPEKVQEVAKGLQYRDFINVGLLLNKMTGDLKDNWIYIQERDVKVGRLMIYNNWGDGMIQDPTKTWIGMEYFCNKTDALWDQSDQYIQNLAIEELERLGLAKKEDVLDATVRKMEKTYPAYFGSYHEFDHIRNYTDKFENIFLIGRNGMHKYNNADHSMLCAMVAVDNICKSETSKVNVWAINTEQEYHENKITRHTDTKKTNYNSGGERFRDFVLKRNRPVWMIALPVLLLEFYLFKVIYPRPNFMVDSQIYLDSAIRNVDINIWPVGYSKFLRIVSAFTTSDNVLVFIQFGMLELAILYFYFTLIYFFRARKTIKWGVLFFLIVNPAVLSVSNYVLSDCLFTALSLIWFTQLLWISKKATKTLIYSNIVLLVVLFTIRHNALYYPLISFAVVSFAKVTTKHKLASIALGTFLLGLFIRHERNLYFQLTGVKQFSPFAGWQLASNALIMYRSVHSRSNDVFAYDLSPLHQVATKVLDSIEHCQKRPDTALQLYFLWMESSPLKQYMNQKWQFNKAASYLEKWASMGPLYSKYGFELIKYHPNQFMRYYVFRNILWYLRPPVEYLGTYNLGRDSVGNLEKEWFRYKSRKLGNTSPKILAIDDIYPAISIVINLTFILAIISLIVYRQSIDLGIEIKSLISVIITVWVCNFVFSILASPIMLRYQIFNQLISFSIGCIILGRVYAMSSMSQNDSLLLISNNSNSMQNA